MDNSANPSVLVKDLQTKSSLSAIIAMEALRYGSESIEFKSSDKDFPNETRSVERWQYVLFKKIGMLYHEMSVALQCSTLKEYKKINPERISKFEMSLITVGDTNQDRSALQAMPFTSNQKIFSYACQLQKLGNDKSERCHQDNYGLMAYHLLTHCNLLRRKDGSRPLLLVASQKDIAKKVTPKEILDYSGDKIERSLHSCGLIQELSGKFDIFVVRPRPRGTDKSRHLAYTNGTAAWKMLIGKDRVFELESPYRLADCFILLSAYASGHLSLGKALIERRQNYVQVEQVYTALKSIL